MHQSDTDGEEDQRHRRQQHGRRQFVRGLLPLQALHQPALQSGGQQLRE